MKTPSTAAELIDAETFDLEAHGYGKAEGVWHQHPDNQLYHLSPEEALVLDINPERWPRMQAAWLAFEACSGYCDNGRFPDYTSECWDEVRAASPDIPMSMDNIEAFAEFCVRYANLSAREAYRAWYKWTIWHFRMEYHLYPTCTNAISDSYKLKQIKDELEACKDEVTALKVAPVEVQPRPKLFGLAHRFANLLG